MRINYIACKPPLRATGCTFQNCHSSSIACSLALCGFAPLDGGAPGRSYSDQPFLAKDGPLFGGALNFGEDCPVSIHYTR